MVSVVVGSLGSAVVEKGLLFMAEMARRAASWEPKLMKPKPREPVVGWWAWVLL